MSFLGLLHAEHEHHHHHSEGLSSLIHQFLENLGLSHEMVEFFSHIFIDCVEIVGMLVIVMTAVFFLQSYISFDKLKAKLAHLKSFWGYGLAVLLGMISPFCSCSIVPVMLGLLSVGVPLSLCLCMLTSASLLNLTALMGIYGILGDFFFQYLAASLFVIAGSTIVMSKIPFNWEELHLHEHGCYDSHNHQEYVQNHHCLDEHHCHNDHCSDENCHDVVGYSSSWGILQRLQLSFKNTWKILKSSWIFILIGVVLSVALGTFFPMEKITEFVDNNGFLSATISALIGFPIHSDLFSMLPVLKLLLNISPISALTFALTTMSISIPTLVLLSRILRPKTLTIYAGSLFSLSLILSYLLLIFA